MMRARLAHDRLVNDDGQRETDRERLDEGYSVAREVAQYRLLLRNGHITEHEFRHAKRRLEAEHDRT
jgi:uncharacterized membrane protein